MSFALGQPVPLRALVYDSTGALDDATGVTLTITLPDGTSATPTVTSPPATTGTYVYDYTPTQAGLHTVRWAFTGTNASAPPVDAFYVDAQTLPPLVSLAEARDQCRIGTTADDPMLQRFLRVASDTCERKTRVWRRQTLTATKDGGRPFLRLRAPIISVTTVTESGATITASGYTIDAERGWLLRGTETSPMLWADGRANVDVTYVAGASDGIVPDPIRQGVLLLTEHLWNSQRGGVGLPRNEGIDFTLPVGFTIPSAVLQEWSPWIRALVA